MPCPFSLYYLRKYTGRNALFTYCGQLNKDSLIHLLLLQGMFLLVRKIGKSCDQSSKKLLKKYPRQFTLDPRKYTLDILPSTLNKNLHSKSAYFLKLTHQESWRSNGFLKGQSQLIHVRIRYHFLADLHVTGHARETWSEDTQNKPCRVELVTSRIMIIEFKPYQSTHFFLYTIEHSPMDLSRESQTSTNTSEFDHQ